MYIKYIIMYHSYTLVFMCNIYDSHVTYLKLYITICAIFAKLPATVLFFNNCTLLCTLDCMRFQEAKESFKIYMCVYIRVGKKSAPSTLCNISMSVYKIKYRNFKPKTFGLFRF